MRRKLLREPLTVIDVGCSGGIDPAWRVFDDRLRAFGFDPRPDECERLQRREVNPNVHYVPAFVGLPADHPFVRMKPNGEPVCDSPWDRLSTAQLLAKRRSNGSPRELAGLNLWPDMKLVGPNDIIQLDRFIEAHGFEDVDFIKVDIDGNDFDVLVSCEEMFRKLAVLGVGMEVNYFGTTAETDHTFHNTDRFLRRHGFELFGLTVRKYSNKNLPAVFLLRTPAQTIFGRPLQGDALYFRDLASTSQADLATQLRPAKLLKLACLFDVFNLPDCAAEILNVFSDRLAEFEPLEDLRDQLVPLEYRHLSYRKYLERFDQGHPMFYPWHWTHARRKVGQTVRRVAGKIKRSVLTKSERA